MSENSTKILDQLVSPSVMKAIDHWITKYPTDQKQSAVMGALSAIQDDHGHLTTELMDALAEYLDMPSIAVYEVATFYTMYKLKPQGKHAINVCTNISCLLRDSSGVIKHLEKKLGIQCGETTSDGRFTLQSVECLGACVNAPMMQVDKDYHENLTPQKIDDVLEQYR